jgi:hypothetical protein
MMFGIATHFLTATTICLAPASTQMASNTTNEALTAVRETFTSFLTGPSIAAKPLTARLPTQAREEAKAAGCQYVLFVTLKQERKQKGGGVLGRVASSAAQQTAGSIVGPVGSTAARVASNAIRSAAIEAASNLATSTKVEDQLELSYRLENGTGQVISEKGAKRKAKGDGEDLLTPLVEQASEQIAAAVAKP